MWSKHAPKSVQFFWNRCRSSTLMSEAVIKLCVYAGTLERCRFVFFLVFLVQQGEGCFFCYLPNGSFGIPLCSVELSPLSCGAVLLERGCVLLGVHVSSAMRFLGVAFEACVFH